MSVLNTYTYMYLKNEIWIKIVFDKDYFLGTNNDKEGIINGNYDFWKLESQPPSAIPTLWILLTYVSTYAP